MSRVDRQSQQIIAAVVLLAAARVAEAQVGACCRSDGICLTTDSAGCGLIVGEFLGKGTLCVSDICVGACCTADKGCVENFKDTCTSAPGNFQGAGTTCDLNCPYHLGTGFTYQGQLKVGGIPITDAVDLMFSLWTAAEGGAQIGATQTESDVDVANGLFTVLLDFGTQAFSGNSRWLEVAVRRPHDPTDAVPFVTLNPRQEVKAAPYATTALSALSVPGLDGHSLDAADGNPTDALFVDNVGNLGIGTTTPPSQLTIREDSDSPNLTAFTQGLANAGINIITDYGSGNYTPGLFWSTANDNATKPKAGIYLRESGTGTEIHLGTSNSYVTGITSDLTIDPTGRVGIGTTTPTGKLHVVGAAGDVILPTSSISAAERFDEPGVASNIRTLVFDMDPTVQTILSRTITVPATGFVLVIGTAEARLDHTENATSEALFGVSPIAGTFPANQDVEVQLSSNARGGVYKYAISVHGLFSVTAGSHPYYFLAQESGGLSTFDDWSVENVQLTLVFFPTAYGTVVSTSANTADVNGTDSDSLDALVAATPVVLGESELSNLEREVADLKARLVELEAMVTRAPETPKSGGG